MHIFLTLVECDDHRRKSIFNIWLIYSILKVAYIREIEDEKKGARIRFSGRYKKIRRNRRWFFKGVEKLIKFLSLRNFLDLWEKFDLFYADISEMEYNKSFYRSKFIWKVTYVARNSWICWLWVENNVLDKLIRVFGMKMFWTNRANFGSKWQNLVKNVKIWETNFLKYINKLKNNCRPA